MARITVDDLRDIFDTDIEYAKLLTFIQTAHVLVNQVVEPKGVLDSDGLFQVELWLAAHFASIKDPIALRSKIGDSEAWLFPAAVTTAWGTGLKLTPYGQMALVMDTSGGLIDLGLRKASFRVAPREDSDNYTPRLTKS